MLLQQGRHACLPRTLVEATMADRLPVFPATLASAVLVAPMLAFG
jgi:hypothetical protein